MYNNELYHARKHKYIAKVKVNGKNRYFYSQEEYDAYLEGRKDQVAVANALKNGTKSGSRSMTDSEKKKADARRAYAKKTGNYDVESWGKNKKSGTRSMTEAEKKAADGRRAYAKKTGNYDVESWSKNKPVRKTMAQINKEKAAAAVKTATNRAATKATKKISNSTRDLRQVAAKKGKEWIDRVLRPGK